MTFTQWHSSPTVSLLLSGICFTYVIYVCFICMHVHACVYILFFSLKPVSCTSVFCFLNTCEWNETPKTTPAILGAWHGADKCVSAFSSSWGHSAFTPERPPKVTLGGDHGAIWFAFCDARGNALFQLPVRWVRPVTFEVAATHGDEDRGRWRAR